jgi:hypothetical protein
MGKEWSKARLSRTPRSGALAASGNEAKIERFGYGLGRIECDDRRERDRASLEDP